MAKDNKQKVKIIGNRSVTSSIINTTVNKDVHAVSITDCKEQVEVDLIFVNGDLLVCKEPLYEAVRQCDASPLPEPKGSFYRIKWWLSTMGYGKGGGRKAFRAKRVNGKVIKGGYVYLKVTQFIDEGDIIHENITKRMPNVSLDKLMEKYTKMADILYEVITDTELGIYVRQCLGMTDADTRKVTDRCLDTYGDKLQECLGAKSSLDTLRDLVRPSANAEARAVTLSREDVLREAVEDKTAAALKEIERIDGDIAAARDVVAELLAKKGELQNRVAALASLIENK